MRIDELAGQLTENNEKIDLNQVLQRPQRSMGYRSSTNELGQGKAKEKKQEVVRQIKLSESGQIFLEANCLFHGHGDGKNIDLAIDKYEQAAKMGNVNASLALGMIYEQGIGVKLDLYDAFVHYHNAAQKMDPHALYKIGDLIEKGMGLEENKSSKKNVKQILGFYKRAIENGSTKAAVRMAQIYENGEYGQAVDFQKALDFYEGVLEDEDEAMNAVGSEHYKRKDYKNAVELFSKAADMGNASAMNNLGTCYELGKGVDKDVLRAYDLYEESAKKGNTQGMSNLGFLYYKEAKIQGSEEQFLEAAHWFRFSIAEDESLKDSHYYLGCMHLNGDGVDQSYSKSYKYFKKAADEGHDISCLKIGDLCYRGFDHNKPDKMKAYEWYSLGAQRGNSQ
jgi:TPR repeat protein